MKKAIRCAIYTRKSTEEGLQQEFNSLDAQREAAEAFIKSQASEGWIPLPEHYDDGGFSGGNMERPALKRLLAGIEAKKIDAVVVYKVDRLSRSLLDFSRLMEVLDRNQCSFVSVTQQFNTTHSMGRLTLNILLSFAQFEREIIAERTKDKMGAARRKGKYVGGRLILGYDVDPSRQKMVVNESEAAMVREIFSIYLHREGLVPTATELNNRGWERKHWINNRGTRSGGGTWDKGNVHRLLTNVTYTGRVQYEGTIYSGEQPAIIDQETWEKTQQMLRRNGRDGGAQVRNKHGALLRGLLRCGHCDHAMTHTWTKKRDGRCYRYYVCVQAMKTGYSTCPTGSLPAGEVEKFVIEQIRKIGHGPALIAEVLRQTEERQRKRQSQLCQDRAALMRQMKRICEETRGWVATGTTEAIGKLAASHDQQRTIELQVAEIDAEITRLAAERIAPEELRAGLAQFDPIWNSLTPREQERMLKLLLEQVVYDSKAGTVAITFRPTGIKLLTGESQPNLAAA